ncbi:hypothetical protein CLSAP_17690 [Clostridium saccharoperbutylacetonicum]|nr:hypothetical protein CLSAP_17690 [Clostridium saccharoperbutylacetonicum]NSB30166.1 hypothetical protein [Clostridium saccharoperbutylacetonicum]
MKNNTIMIIVGSTNGYVGEELLLAIDQIENFSRNTFHRGVIIGPGRKINANGTYFNTDIVIEKIQHDSLFRWKRLSL